jgi:hypothetical protein
MHRSWKGIRPTAISALILAGLIASASAFGAPAPAEHEAATPAGASADDSVKLMDPMSQLVGTQETWSVSRTEAGCYLISPRRTRSSSLAVGRHPKLGLGLFVVGFALSVPKANTGEPVVIEAEGGDLNRVGRMVGAQLLFVPLDSSDIESSLRSLKDTGLLGLVVRDIWIAHGGQEVTEAVAKYDRDCAHDTTGSK